MFSLRIHLLLIRFRFSLAIFVPCLLLARSLRSQAQHNPGTLRTPKTSINPAKQRPKTDWKAVEFISWRSLVNACWTEELFSLPSDRTLESGKLETAAAQWVAGLGINLTSNLTAKADSILQFRCRRCVESIVPTLTPAPVQVHPNLSFWL